MALLQRFGDSMASPAAALRRAQKRIEAGDRTEAFPLLARAARAGIAEAEFLVGRAYLDGAGVPPSATEAARWLERAAERGYVEAQTLIAAIYLHGVASRRPAPGEAVSADAAPTVAELAGPASTLFRASVGVEPDPDRAAVWARRAADAGSAEGQALLGYLLTSGPDSLRDVEAGEALYRRSAEAHCPQGHLGYALALLRQAQTPAMLAQAGEQLSKASEAGLGTAQYLLGVLHEQGRGVAQDLERASALYAEAAGKGIRAAQARYGLALLNGQGVERDPQEGESWLRRAALEGDPEAAAVVGDLYARGGELPPNHAEAAMWFRRAAEAGHKTAARALGLLHLTGAGVPRDPAEAARWFRISAEAGDPQAKQDLANLVLQGKGEPADAERIRTWFEQAATAGDLVAAFNYGICLAEGVGIARDDAQAVQWLRRAAQGVVNAQVPVRKDAYRGAGRGGRSGRGASLDHPCLRSRYAGRERGLGRADGKRKGRCARPSGRIEAVPARGRAWPCGCHVRACRHAGRWARCAVEPAGGAEMVPYGGRARAPARADDAGALPGAWPRW